MSALIGQKLGPYHILEMIGRGGMATIYKAYQPSTDRLVAVKVLLDSRTEDPHVVRRFEHEAHVIAGLEHRHIVPVYDFGQEKDLLYLVMRYMRAGTVSDLLRRGSLTPADAACILQDVAAALDYAHQQGVIHRDIKPNNILVDAQGHSHLTDFGLAKVLGESLELTRSGASIGTPAYMAPEQVADDPISPRTDIYALGVMLYEMTTGVLPFSSDSPMATALMHLQHTLRPAREINPMISIEVEAVIQRAMEKRPEKRFGSAGEMATALTQAAGGVSRPGMIAGDNVVHRSELSTLAPVPALQAIPQPDTTLHLSQLAREVAETRSPEEVTPEIRRALRRQQQEAQRKRLFAFAPWAAVGLLVMALSWTLVAFVRGSADSQASASATATAVQALILQLSDAQTAMAGNVPGAQATLSHLQTQIASVSSPQANLTLTNAVNARTPTPIVQAGSTQTGFATLSTSRTPTSQAATTSPGSTTVPGTSAPTSQPQPTSVLPPVVNTSVPVVPPVINTLVPDLPGLIPTLGGLLP
jgi:serine/threonine protein kinase